jgi:hypothetical protein
MSINDDWTRDVLDSIRDSDLSIIRREVDETLARYSRASNEVRAQLAFDIFSDGCYGFDIPGANKLFSQHYPELAFYAENY